MRLAPDRTILSLAAVFCVAAAALLWQQSRTHSRLVHSIALEGAARLTDAMREFRTLYTSEVVDSVVSHGIEVSHDYQSKDGAIPLPATLSMLLGNAIAERGSGGELRLYSPYPFPWRQETGGLRDDFDRRAWEALSRNPDEAWSSFDELGGRPVLRYATADVLRASCVGCHNSHPESPKTDWKEGDVRGVMEVVVPLDAAIAQAQTDRRESAMAVMGLVGLGLFAVLLVTRRLRRTSEDLEKRVVERTSELEESRQDLKQAMGSVQASEERFRGIYETMADGYIRDALPGGEILEANPAAARICGYSSVEALKQKSAWDFVANPADNARIAELFQKQDEFQGLELELLRADGSHVPVLYNGRILRDDEGRPAVLEATFFDMSAQKETEAELEQARANAEDASRAKSVFLANMSHELRTPMNAIIGYSEILQEDAEDEGNEDAARDLGKIHAAGTHLLRLINDVLDLSKVEAGKMELYLESFQVSAMVEQVVNTIDALVKKNDNHLKVEVDPSLGEMQADLTKVRQALFNLLSNAAKFTHEGEIALVVRGEREQGEDWVQMAVTDSGIGIPPEKLHHVFEEFSQADESTTRDYGGTGLGLPISRRFCQMMGGDITLASTPGEGSTFTIRLPMQVEPLPVEPDSVEADSETPTAAMAMRPEASSGTTVLVVDDDRDTRDLLARTLQGTEVRVVTAADGPEALQLARQLRPAAITLDVMMPGMDGWEVLRQLKGDAATRDIPVFMVTMTDNRELGYALGATEFLTKPVQRRQLVELLERYALGEADKRALVVDDQQANRDALRRALENEGWRVSEAENGRVALEQLDENRPTLILLDLMMPVMDGFEFVMEMRKRDDARSIPIVVVTAKDVTEEDRRRLNGDVVGLIQRSGLDRDALLEQLREHVAASGH